MATTRRPYSQTTRRRFIWRKVVKTTPMPVTRTMMLAPSQHQPALLKPTMGGSTADVSTAQAAMTEGFEKACCGDASMPDADD